MDYTRILFSGLLPDKKEILMARCTLLDISGMEETDDGFIVYCQEDAEVEDAIRSIERDFGCKGIFSQMPDQNWNREWEKNFQPVYLDDFCCIRADFHPAPVGVDHDIVITPKMSFGTGHHATTELMIREMRQLDLRGRAVLDFGTGTGILAILAEQLGAAPVLAIDNDDRAVENAAENLLRNKTNSVTLEKGSLTDLSDHHRFDVLLANINRNVILREWDNFYRLLQPGGLLMLSGVLTEDEAKIKTAAGGAVSFIKQEERNGWQMLLFRKELGG